jgi:hypothetical protein
MGPTPSSRNLSNCRISPARSKGSRGGSERTPDHSRRRRGHGGVGLTAVLVWLLYTTYLNRLERQLAYRKGLYRDLVAGLATRDRALLEPVFRDLSTLRDFEALEAVLEEQARGATERPAWLLDAYDRLGLVDKYVAKLGTATQWRERAFAAELLGRVGNAKAVPALLRTIEATRTEDADVREISLRALARIADPRAVAPLVEALKKSEGWLAPRIADILQRHGPLVVEPMIGFLDDPVRHLARLGGEHPRRSEGAPRVPDPGAGPERPRRRSPPRARRPSARSATARLTYLIDHLLSDPRPSCGPHPSRSANSTPRGHRPAGPRPRRPGLVVRMRSVEALEQIGGHAEVRS